MKPLLLFASFFILFSSCKKIIQELVKGIDYNYETKDILLTASLFQPAANGDLKGYVDYEFQKNSLIDQVEEAKLKSITVNIISPDSITFGIVKDVNVYIYTDSANGNIPSKLIAYKTNIPTNTGRELGLDITNVNLVEYLQRDKYLIRTEVVLRQAITKDVTLKNKLVFNLKPKA